MTEIGYHNRQRLAQCCQRPSRRCSSAKLMRRKHLILSILFLLALSLPGYAQADNYEPGPDSKPQAGVPKGETLKFVFDRSKIFPGTTREYWVYVPAQYTPDKPACVYVGQDGIKYNAPVVFDNLIAKKEMPVTIGVFAMHGRVTTPNADTGQDRYNRSFEYDGLGDNYVRFLLEELLPEVETKRTSDGRAIRLSHNGNDRAIGGESSGAIAAFTAAWERPAEFSRVFSAIGTYVGLRGGEIYPTLIRKYEPKPIRVFLQDGSNDLNIYGGDWWMANQTMERALVFAGYEVQQVWGDGGHTGRQSTMLFPDAMRLLWKDWPQPVKAGVSKNATLADILIPDEGWQLVADGYKQTAGAATDAHGRVFFDSANKTWVMADGKPLELSSHSKQLGEAFGPDGRLYAVAPQTRKIVAYNVEGEKKVKEVASGIVGSYITVGHNGNAYVTEPSTGKIWLITPNGKKLVVDMGLKSPSGITFSADQTQLFVADAHSHWVYIYSIQETGTLTNKQRYYWLHFPDDLDWSGAGGMQVDSLGRLYVATAMGIQVADQPGRVQCIIPTPNGRVDDVAFGGAKLDTIYVMSNDRIYKRKLKIKGVLAWGNPVKPPMPRQ